MIVNALAVGLTAGVVALVGVGSYLSRRSVENEVSEAKIAAYREILANLVTLNRQLLMLDYRDDLQSEHSSYIWNRGSELDDEIDAVRLSHQKNMFVIGRSVHDRIGEYQQYVTTYQEPFEPDKPVRLTGNIVRAMRDDLGLDDIFDEQKQEQIEAVFDE